LPSIYLPIIDSPCNALPDDVIHSSSDKDGDKEIGVEGLEKREREKH